MAPVALDILTFVVLCISSMTDFRKREVPDWISHGFIAGALGLRLLTSITLSDASHISTGILGALVFFAVSYTMYYFGQWGGGDVKIAAGMGASLGLSITAGLYAILVLFAGAIYGIMYSIVVATQNKIKFKKAFHEAYKHNELLVVFSGIALGISLIVTFINFSIGMFALGIAGIFAFGIFAFIFVKSVEDSCFYTSVSSRELTEGDWVVDTIVMNGKTVIKGNNEPITQKQIDALKHYHKRITVKIGIPFIPAFLLGYIVLFFAEPFFWGILGL